MKQAGFVLAALVLASTAAWTSSDAPQFIESRATFLGHPIHPMLVAFPIGLLTTSLLFDVLYLIRREELFRRVSYYLMLLGVIGGLAAAIPGIIDFAALPSGDVRQTATVHWQLNAIVMALFIINLVLRRTSTAGRGVMLGVVTAFSVIGIGLMMVSAWYGGHLVYTHRVGVHAPERMHHHE